MKPQIKWEDVPPIQSIEDIVTVKELAEMLKVRVGLIHGWRTKSNLPYIRLGMAAYYSKTQVVAWINNFQRTVPDRFVVIGAVMSEKYRKR